MGEYVGRSTSSRRIVPLFLISERLNLGDAMPGPAPRASSTRSRRIRRRGSVTRSSVWPAERRHVFEHKVDCCSGTCRPRASPRFRVRHGHFLGSRGGAVPRSSCRLRHLGRDGRGSRARWDAGALPVLQAVARARCRSQTRSSTSSPPSASSITSIRPRRLGTTARAGPRAEAGRTPRRLRAQPSQSGDALAGGTRADRRQRAGCCARRNCARLLDALRRRARAHGLHPVLPATVRRLWSLERFLGARAAGGHMWSSAESRPKDERGRDSIGERRSATSASNGHLR